MRSRVNFSRPFILELDFYPTQDSGGWIGAYHGTMDYGTFNTAGAEEHTFHPHGGGGNSYMGHCDDGGCYHGNYVTPMPLGQSVQYKIRFTIRDLISGPRGVFDSYAKCVSGGGPSITNTGLTTAATTGDNPLLIGFYATGGTAGDNFEFDNIRLRSYVVTEPIISSTGQKKYLLQLTLVVIIIILFLLIFLLELIQLM